MCWLTLALKQRTRFQLAHIMHQTVKCWHTPERLIDRFDSRSRFQRYLGCFTWRETQSTITSNLLKDYQVLDAVFQRKNYRVDDPLHSKFFQHHQHAI